MWYSHFLFKKPRFQDTENAKMHYACIIYGELGRMTATNALVLHVDFHWNTYHITVELLTKAFFDRWLMFTASLGETEAVETNTKNLGCRRAVAEKPRDAAYYLEMFYALKVAIIRSTVALLMHK